MSSGLYSGVSGLALGIGLYKGVSGLWGGASGLIDGFGGGSPFDGASLYLDFLYGSLDSRITFSRGTTATFVGSNGLIQTAAINAPRFDYDPVTLAPKGLLIEEQRTNLLLYSQQFDDVFWTKSNAAALPFNPATATSGPELRGTGAVGLFGTATAATYNPSTGVGTCFRVNASNQSFVTFTGLNSASYYAVVITCTSAAISMSVRSGAFSGITTGVLLTGDSRTVYCNGATSITLTDAGGGSSFTVTSINELSGGLIIAPDGTNTADAVIETTATGVHQIYCLVSVGVATYTWSFYAKANGRTQIQTEQESGGAARFTLSGAGTALALGANTVSIQNVGSGWYRCTSTFTVTGPFGLYFTLYNGGTNYTGDGVSGIFLWGAQLEAGSFATTYIPTVASQVTRSADNALMIGTNFSSWYNQSEGTFVADFDKYSATSRGGVLCAGNISGGTGTGITLDGQNDGKVRAFIENAGAVEMLNATLANYTANTPIKGAIAYATNNAVGAAAGALGTVDTSVVVPTVDNFQIGAIRNSATTAALPLNGHIRSIAYYNTRLANAQLQQLTAPPLVTTLSLDFINGVYDA